MSDVIELEVLSRKPAGAVKPTPLLFIHGAYSSAQQWLPFFLPYFAEHGYAAYAMSVRGHGKSAGRETVRCARLRDYVADVMQVMQTLPAAPVLIGHSLGGLIVQKILQERAVPAAVLMCSAPPHGLLPSALTAMITNPLMYWEMAAMQRLGPKAATVDGSRRALFLDETPDDWVRKVFPTAELESDAVMLDASFLDLPPSTGRRDMPVMVLGGGRDACITRSAVEETARAFGVTPVMFENLPHALMLVPEWQTVARAMLDWLDNSLAMRAKVPVPA